MAKGVTRPRARTTTSASSCWTPVSVGLEDSGTKEEENHYDDTKLSRKAAKDLQVNPGEDVAMFYGLEVLDSSQYKLVSGINGSNSKQIVMLTGDEKEKTTLENKNSSKKRKAQQTELEQADSKAKENNQVQEATDKTAAPLPKKKKRKKKKKKTKESNASTGSQQEEPSETSCKGPLHASADLKKTRLPLSPEPVSTGITPYSEEKVQELQQAWSQAVGGAQLHTQLCESLLRLGFPTPTPIQAATLSAATLGRRNLVGAAPTGSGKTLAFLLPILQTLLEEQPNTNESEKPNTRYHHKPPIAMIVIPTRELATQIHEECDKLLPGKCVSLVGGIALVKQTRILKTRKPPIIIGTPGRLWAMISSGEHEHLNDLSQLRFLVLDEADRMTQVHSFPQLVQILNQIHLANPREEDLEDLESEDDEDDGVQDRLLLGLPGIRGEAALTMLTDDILDQVESQRAGTTKPEAKEVAEDEFRTRATSDEKDDDSINFKEDEFETVECEPIHRQTFIYSATLTLPYTLTANKTQKKRRKGRQQDHGLEGGIAEILEKTRAMGETKVVDLSWSKPTAATSTTAATGSGVQLPPGLRLEQIKCTQMHKDSHLYAYLMTTSQGSSGPCLVFCNSIAAVRRVGTTMQTLGLSVRVLHAHMQQRARFKAVESLKESSTSRVVVVCTDVAARGLDIPSVATVIHYDSARSVDTFVHRSGRTARGIGKDAVGSSLSLISPAEDKAHTKIVEAVQVTFSKILLDGRLMTSAQERVSLASKIVAASDMEQKTQSSNKWFLEKAEEAGLAVDEGLLEDDDNRSERELVQLKEARKAKVRLAQLLTQPMKTQRFGKFLSTNSAALQDEIKPLPAAVATKAKVSLKRRKVKR